MQDDCQSTAWLLKMTFNELLEAANSLQREFLDDDKAEPISERTLRYWISKGVLKKRATRGPKTNYPDSFVWRVVLTRQFQLFTSKTLDEIADTQAQTADEDVMTVVRNFRNVTTVAGDTRKHKDGADYLAPHIEQAVIGSALSDSKWGAPSRLWETAVEDLRYDVSRFIRDMENQMRKQMDSRDDALVASRVSMQSALDEYLDRHIRETEIVARVINEAREDLLSHVARLSSEIDQLRKEISSLQQSLSDKDLHK